MRDLFSDQNSIWPYLQANQQHHKVEPLKRLDVADMKALFKKGSAKPFVKRPRPSWWSEDYDSDEENDGDPCCPFHDFRIFDAWKNEYVLEAYENCCAYTREKLLEAPLLMLNQELVINESNIKITGDKMYILKEPNAEPTLPINFAACWGEIRESEFIFLDQEISAPQLFVPPLLVHEFDQGYHFVLDFFRNDWIVKVNDRHKVPVPIISNDVPQDGPCDSPFRASVQINNGKVDLFNNVDYNFADT
ncbi:hypothetical protein VTO42DRAFT_2289 [Malbranchea cinnamomea]